MTPSTHTLKSTLFAALLVSLGAGIALLAAGPLNPPSGAVSSSNKTLAEVEPRIAISDSNTPGSATALYRITAPGSYYLTGNITGVSGKHGVLIESSGVTVDLNGFDLIGVPGALDGVSALGTSLTNIAVLNGSVRNWGDEGVDLGTVGVKNGRVEGVKAFANVGSGVSVAQVSIVTRCTCLDNGAQGIAATNCCTISDCAVSGNTGYGIQVGLASTVTGCSAYGNVSGGIATNLGCSITNCSSYSNAASGILAGGTSTVLNCVASVNGGSGISVGLGGSVMNCVARSNTADGIFLSGQCTILNNTCSSNGNGAGDGAGIHANGTDNRIEGNNCTGADRGIAMDLGGNILVRNVCSGNTVNWALAANNVFGTIVDRTSPASAVVSGNAAVSSAASSDPNANFTY